MSGTTSIVGSYTAGLKRGLEGGSPNLIHRTILMRADPSKREERGSVGERK